MSAFGGGFGGFGQNNNNQQQSGTGFGGFGGTNTNTGFGSSGNTGFGGTNTNTGGGLFGSGGTAPTGGFGSTGGAFGTTQNAGAFGASKPSGFGASATTGGGLFGSNTATTTGTSGGFGGFGGNNSQTTSGGFGTNNTTSLFGGGSKPATTGFGGAAPTTSTGFGGFGQNNNNNTNAATGGFGGSPAIGATGECQGTGSTPFQATVEKEPNTTSNQQNSFQSISFQAPYQKFSPEELRLADYAQGRRYGNASNQAGAFGQNTGFGGATSTPSTGFGGFGANNNTTTSSNLFGGSANTSTGFGTNQPAATGFGANTGNSLFGGANKPATPSLFGAQPQQQNTGGGLFGGGASAGASTGFGGAQTSAFGNNSTNTGGGLFGGGNNNNTAAKPAGFSFGGQPASTGFGGAPAATTTSAFGSGGGGLFGGGATQQQNNTSNPFGAQQPAATNTFGGFGGAQPQNNQSSLFGGANNQQQKPAGGLFGGSNTATTGTTGGLFGGGGGQPASTGGLFGGANNTQTGGLFGGAQAQKPAATGGLFGGAGTGQQNNTSSLFGGGFGQNNNQQNQTQQNSNSLFGNKPAGGSLFGATQPQQSQQQSSGGLFGNTNSQNGGLFGNSTNNNQQQQSQQGSSFGGGSSLFGNSTPGQQSAQVLTASLNDTGAFGSGSMFRELGSGPVNNPGPLATPLSSLNKQKRPAALPLYKLNSASSSRFATPQKKGFGFSYSSYGTPNSASSTSSTPGGFGNSLLGGLNQSRGLSKSMSTSSLRNSFNNDTSILAPGAFSASPATRQYGSTGSMKRLVINRGLRGDLFSPPPQSQPPAAATKTNGILKKRVSFDGNGMSASNGSQNNFSSPLKQVTSTTATPSAQEQGFIRPRPASNGSSSATPNGTENQTPEMEQVKGNELAIVPEEEAANSAARNSQPKPASQPDRAPGEYWMSPTKEEILAMSRTQRAKVSGFTVGRQNTGQVTFDVPVDLTNINLDEILDKIVVLDVRSCTVYPNASQKPPMGKGLNVPSTIMLENSWPRQKDKRTISTEKAGAHFNKHVSRLQKVEDTHFVSYDKDTGVWTFSVDHFTTYGLEYDEDETEGEEGVSQFDQSVLSAPPDTPTPSNRTPRPQQFDDSYATTSDISRIESDPEDTFEFRKKKVLPGAFDEQELYEDDTMQGELDEQSFLDERSVGSQSENGVDEPMDQDDVFQEDESVSIVDQEMAGSFPQAGVTTELEGDDSLDDESHDMDQTPGALVRARLRARNGRTPSKNFTAGDDWTSMLKTTISPQKQDRAFLKSLINVHGNDSPVKANEAPLVRNRVVSDGRGFATSIDLMNSLFGQAKSPQKVAKVPAPKKGFEWPYAKRPKTGDSDMSDLDDMDRAFHESMKPSWGPDGTLVYAAPSTPKQFGRSSRRAREKDGLLAIQKRGVVSASRDVRFAKFSNESAANMLNKQKSLTIIQSLDGIPSAQLTEDYSFIDFYDDRNGTDPSALHEKLVWELASILFDEMDVPEELQQVPNALDRLRKDRFSVFWQKIVEQASARNIAMARTPEEKAIAALSGHRVSDACGQLMNSKNYHLATLVALIGGKESLKKDIREQLNDWQKSNFLSEFSQPIRAIYELLAGNVCVCDGSKGAPVEDRIDSFIISKRFGLDWRQAFGLRLWYSIQATDDLRTAVEIFAQDLAQDRELAFPEAWYVEQMIPTLWEDDGLEDREDLLWGLLKLYTFNDPNVESILRPENSQLSPLDARLSWQLSRALTTFGIVSYGDDAEDKADRATLSFAAQLINEGSWLDAIFVLLHLNNADARAKTIKDHLAQTAGLIGSEDSHSFATLTQTYKIPTSWIWEAKALYMRSVEKDPISEVECLIHAGAFEEAHRTFIKEVAPKAIVERDYDTLNALLRGFNGKEEGISEWHLGGEVYSDFLALLSSQKKAAGVSPDVVERLLAGLPAMVEESRHPAFMETVAVEIISNSVAKSVVDMKKSGQNNELSRVLQLPLTEDRYLRHTVDISIDYYKSVMVAGR
ncbi:nucleoporin autopeptidase [Phlyctema vagabunda]|uniref:Nucleoporin autopeptidase n=1 Tax=Phlyctema vagabunda TaxID=108571 RepID=A0ABR4PK86_9HELO